jgi:EAL domain-containing protein (putative c-di-GMP-specific phosphodiesterase class I)
MGVAPRLISVNLSPRQFQSASIVEQVRVILAETGLAASNLELEITEGALLKMGPEATAKMAALKALGVKLAIDDFGTGYSSLAYLKRLPLDRLKIDKSFVRDMATKPQDAAIVGAIIDLAKRLEFDIVAEGVETSDQVEKLRQLGCGVAQGYYFARPLHADELLYLLRLPRTPGPADWKARSAVA